MFKNSQTRLLILFILVLATQIAAIFFSYHAIQALIANQKEIAQSYEVLNSVNDVISTLKDAETGQRGYLLTGAEKYLEPYNRAVPIENEDMIRLHKLTANSPVQQGLLVQLEDKTFKKLAELDQTIRIYKRGEKDSAIQIVLSDVGRQTMDDIRVIIGEMQDQNENLLANRLAQTETSNRQAQITLILSGSLGVLMLLFFYWQVKKRIEERGIWFEKEQVARTAAEKALQSEQLARQSAENASRLKDEFLSTVSHELRTPLNAILGWVQMLRTRSLDKKTADNALATVERNARSQAQLVEDLLDMSRIISGKMRLEIKPLELASVVESAVATVQPAVEARGIRLIKLIETSASTVSGDFERLQQALWNLLSNAIKFTPKGGRVEIRIERVSSSVEIIVRDNGSGIEPEFLPHVFDLFRQADGSTSKQHGGLGLGLAITKSIVELHGGQITAESAGIGKGATFRILLPLRGMEANIKEAAGIGAPQETKTPQLPELNFPDSSFNLDGLRVLVVDDQTDTLELIKVVLSKWGAIVQTASNANDGFKYLQTWKPDLLISDIGMPETDGFAFIRMIRELSPENGGTTPAVALTAFARIEDRLKILLAGFQMHVPKPVEPVELVAIVASLTGRN